MTGIDITMFYYWFLIQSLAMPFTKWSLGVGGYVSQMVVVRSAFTGGFHEWRGGERGKSYFVDRMLKHFIIR